MSLQAALARLRVAVVELDAAPPEERPGALQALVGASRAVVACLPSPPEFAALERLAREGVDVRGLIEREGP